MVKRKKPGSCSAQEEKRPEESSTETGKEAGDASVPNRAEVQPAAVQQLARTRSQNAPRLGSPSGLNSAAAGDDGVSEKQEVKSAVPVQRSSLRVTKRPRKDASPPPSSSNPPATNAAANKKSAVSKQGGADAGKTRRPWELWSIEDKNAFFEAVCEFGKDFESIQSYIAQRSKKKGVPAHCIKNKDQVRHFYYRTWHKIAKVMDIGEGREDVKKQTQELYGLINYAELRKKYSACINQKSGQLLTELVLTGSTMVKIRGKRIRIKTPVCRALKKINNVDTKDEPPKLPPDVWVEFRPRTNAAWVQVQSLAQNPRVRTKTSLQRRLSNVLEHLQARWKPLRLRQKEQVVASLAGTDCKALASMEPEVAQELRVWPSTPISPVSISAMASSLDVSFQCHRKKAATMADGLKSRPTRPTKQSRAIKAAASQTSTTTTTSSTATGNAAQDSTTDAVASIEPAQQNNSSGGSETASQGSSVPSSPPPPAGQVEENPEDEAAKSLTLLRSMLEPDPPATTASTVSETQCSATPNSCLTSSPPVTPTPMPAAIECVQNILADGSAVAGGLTLGQLLGKAAEEARQGGEEEEDEEEKARRKKKKQEAEEQEEKRSQQEQEEEAKRKEEEEHARERSTKGWTAQEAGLMTIGELYLMMGCPSKIILHYDFCPVEQKVDRKSKISLECTTMLKKLLSLATVMFAEKSKQGPLSPPAGRCGSSAGAGGGRGTAAVSGTPPSGKSGGGGGSGGARANAGGTPPSGKSAASRALGRSPSTRTAQRPTLQQVQQAQVLENAADGSAATTASGTDQHVFVVPMGMAPRAHKQAGVPGMPTNITHQEQLDRLVPGNRRGMRLRAVRKPLVVQRPLLPRADRRPVTLVQLLPSTQATLAAVVQPLASDPLPQGKGIVKLIHPAATTNIAGATFDMQPVQVPLIDASSVAMAVSSSGHSITTSSPAVVEATSTSTVLVASQQAHTVAVVQSTPQTTNLVVDEPPVLALAESTEAAKTLAEDPLDVAATAAASPVRVQPLSPPNISSLLDISLPESLPSEGTTAQILDDAATLPNLGAALSGLSSLDTDGPAIEASNPLPSFTAVSDSNLASAFKLACEEASVTPVEKTTVIDKTDGLTTPPMSPFKLVHSAPDPNWLNGEGSNFSLSSLLNTLDSPLKVTPVVTPVAPEPPVLALENSSLDSISRLAPDVDTQLQCLMNENSVDYVAKFADLAAQIASSNSESKAT
ncbi:protein cramped-like [Dermacentor silvarum]|uniref:protein cramped-like n=1 Tax=Dermacentor silvarum TaxID=543639 RepID=UPI00189A8222|nr:protein cramped-like [Dermacentor silvarum]